MKKNLWRTNDLVSDNAETFNGLEVLFGNDQDPYIKRLAFEEGPAHHSFSNWILANSLFTAIRKISEQLEIDLTPYDGKIVEVPMNRPHHHHHRHHFNRYSGSGTFPLDLPVDQILDLAEGDEQRTQEMIDALSEGAPHHVMGNILLMHLVESLVNIAKKHKVTVKNADKN